MTKSPPKTQTRCKSCKVYPCECVTMSESKKLRPLNVRQLIEKLQSMPQDWPVWLCSGPSWEFPVNVEAREDRFEKAVLIQTKDAAQ